MDGEMQILFDLLQPKQQVYPFESVHQPVHIASIARPHAYVGSHKSKTSFSPNFLISSHQPALCLPEICHASDLIWMSTDETGHRTKKSWKIPTVRPEISDHLLLAGVGRYVAGYKTTLTWWCWSVLPGSCPGRRRREFAGMTGTGSGIRSLLLSVDCGM